MSTPTSQLRYCRDINVAHNDGVAEDANAQRKIAVTVTHHAGWHSKDMGKRLTFALRDADARIVAEEIKKLLKER